MIDCTIYRHEDGSARVIEWKDRDNPTQEELHPEGARLIIYTVMPHDWMECVKRKTKNQVSEILSHFIP